MYVTNVNQHVCLEDCVAWIHFLEYPKTNLAISDEIRFVSNVKPYLKVPAIVLLTLLLVSEWYHEVIDHYLLFSYIIVKHRRLSIILPFVNVGQRAKIGEAIKARTAAIFLTLRLNCSI